MAAAASAPVAPSGSSSGVPSGRVTFIAPDATRAPSAPAFRARSERAFVSGCYGHASRGIAGCLIPDRAVALRRPRAGALVEEIAAARLPLAEPERAPPRAHGARSQPAPDGRDFDHEAQEAVGRVRRVRRDRRPCRRGPRRRRPHPGRARPTQPGRLGAGAPPGRARRAAPGAAQGARDVTPACAAATCTASRRGRWRACAASAARCARTSAELRRTGGAPNVPVPAVLQSIAACESGGDPHAVGGGGRSAASTSSTTARGRASAAAATRPPRPRPSRTAARPCSTPARARRRGPSAAGR